MMGLLFMSSEIYINRGALVRSNIIYPQGHNIYLGSGYNIDALGLGADGLYDWRHAEERREQFAGKIALDPSSITLEEFQTWCIGNWKKPQGSHDSAIRFGNKIVEESEELGVAFRDHVYRKPDQQQDIARKEIVSELGDTLFCINALAANSTCPMDDAAQDYLLRMGMGVLSMVIMVRITHCGVSRRYVLQRII